MPGKDPDEKQFSLFDCPLPKIRRVRCRDIGSTTLRQEMEAWRKRCEAKKLARGMTGRMKNKQKPYPANPTTGREVDV
jgi:hypothetical protein